MRLTGLPAGIISFGLVVIIIAFFAFAIYKIYAALGNNAITTNAQAGINGIQIAVIMLSPDMLPVTLPILLGIAALAGYYYKENRGRQ